MDKLRVGIIGCGSIATDKHMPGLSKIDQVEIAAFFDINKECAQRASSNFGIEGAKVYSHVDELLDNKDIDVVHICTTVNTHADLSIRAMEAGKHVMCEKPMAANSEEAKKMLAMSKKTGKKLTIGCQNRFREDTQYLKKACDRGDLGEIYYAKALALRRRAVPSWLLVSKEDQGGGPLMDIGTHALDITLWMMDNFKPKSVLGKTYRKLAQRENEANMWDTWDPKKFFIPEAAFGFITMENGATVLLESSWALNIRKPYEARTLLCGTDGGADITDGLWINGTEFGQFYEKQITTERTINFSLYGSDFTDRSKYVGGDLETRSWIESILYDKELVVKPEESLVVMQILEAVNESASLGKPVYF